jgi:hypothetical protein
LSELERNNDGSVRKATRFGGTACQKASLALRQLATV